MIMNDRASAISGRVGALGKVGDEPRPIAIPADKDSDTIHWGHKHNHHRGSFPRRFSTEASAGNYTVRMIRCGGRGLRACYRSRKGASSGGCRCSKTADYGRYGLAAGIGPDGLTTT